MLSEDLFSVLFVSVFIIIFLFFLGSVISNYSEGSKILSDSERALTICETIVGLDSVSNETLKEIAITYDDVFLQVKDLETNETWSSEPKDGDKKITVSLPILMKGDIALASVVVYD